VDSHRAILKLGCRRQHGAHAQRAASVEMGYTAVVPPRRGGVVCGIDYGNLVLKTLRPRRHAMHAVVCMTVRMVLCAL
jgi:hypothetical protein